MRKNAQKCMKMGGRERWAATLPNPRQITQTERCGFTRNKLTFNAPDFDVGAVCGYFFATETTQQN